MTHHGKKLTRLYTYFARDSIKRNILLRGELSTLAFFMSLLRGTSLKTLRSGEERGCDVYKEKSPNGQDQTARMLLKKLFDPGSMKRHTAEEALARESRMISIFFDLPSLAIRSIFKGRRG